MRPAHVLWNLLGLGVPLIIAVLAIPALLGLIGAERFGFLALAWGLIGYASALDLGIGRATNQRVSALRSNAGDHQIPDVIATAIRITLGTGVAGMSLIIMATLSGAQTLVAADTVPADEIKISMLLLALALPLQAVSATYRGINEAYLNFKGINYLRMFFGITNFGAPYLISIFAKEMYWLIAALVLSSLVVLLSYRHLAHQCLKNAKLNKRGIYVKAHAHMLLKFGGWFSISSVVGPLMVYADRFFIGGLISAAAVTFYVIPYEVAIQMLIFTGAVTTVIFPFLTNLLQKAPKQANVVFRLWLYRISGMMAVIMTLLAYAMPKLLESWVGDHIAGDSVRVGQILCLGVFINAVGTMFFSICTHMDRPNRQQFCI